ncbi:MAG TPA: XRE family transcriptional regulator, partial [Clostridium sp.]|nr:XRE family transcriptional regulator [Clostridium sp.]
MKEVSIHVGKRIRLYRKLKKLTIEVFAEMIHKSKATVSKYENGEISIDIE